MITAEKSHGRQSSSPKPGLSTSTAKAAAATWPGYVAAQDDRRVMHELQALLREYDRARAYTDELWKDLTPTR